MAARVTQEAAEVAVEPESAKARVTQITAEVIAEPDSAKARVSQMAVEVVVGRIKKKKQFIMIG